MLFGALLGGAISFSLAPLVNATQASCNKTPQSKLSSHTRVCYSHADDELLKRLINECRQTNNSPDWTMITQEFNNQSNQHAMLTKSQITSHCQKLMRGQ